MTSGTEKKPSRRLAVLLAWVFVVIYVLPLTVAYAMQRELLFQPDTQHVGSPGDFGLKDVKVIPVKTEDGLLLHDWFRPPRNGDKYVIVLFHGTQVSLGYIAALVPYFARSNHGLFLCEYRGFGDSPAVQPTEQGIYRDARAAVRWLTAHGYPADHQIFYGSSLGTGVAVQMATETPPALLILHGAYTSIPDVAKFFFPFFPVGLLIKDRFDSVDKIGKIHVPLLMIHGTDDNIIPIADARKLFAAASEPKTFWSVRHFMHIDLLFSPSIYLRVLAWIDRQLQAKSPQHI